MAVTHVRELLSPYVDDELSAREREQVRRHLDVCAECRNELEAIRRTVGFVRSLDPAKVPDGLRAQVRTQLETSPPPARRWVPLWSWSVALAAAAVLLVGVFSVNLFREMRPSARLAEPERPGVDLAVPPGELRSGAPAPAAPSAPGAPVPLQSQPKGPAFDARKIVRTADLALDVDKFDAAGQMLLQIAERAGGFIANSSSSEENGVPQGMFTLRVPASRFGTVVAQIEALGVVTQRQIGGQDVTEEFVDLQARVRNLERHEQRLLSFMDRATKVSDLLAIEEQLARVRGEIEQLTGRLRFLERSADLATVTVAVTQKAKKTSGALWDISGTLSKMQAAFLATVRQILAVVEWFGVAASALVPVLLLGAAAWFLLRRLARSASMR